MVFAIFFLFQLPNEGQFVVQAGGKEIKFSYTTGTFDPEQNSISPLLEGDPRYAQNGTVFVINGLIGYGTDLHHVPERQIEGMTVSFNGRAVTLERKFYSDCFEPNFSADSFSVKPTIDGEKVLLVMEANTYSALWIVTEAGQVTRFIFPLPDCSVFNLDCLNAANIGQ